MQTTQHYNINDAENYQNATHYKYIITILNALVYSSPHIIPHGIPNTRTNNTDANVVPSVYFKYI